MFIRFLFETQSGIQFLSKIARILKWSLIITAHLGISLTPTLSFGKEFDEKKFTSICFTHLGLL